MDLPEGAAENHVPETHDLPAALMDLLGALPSTLPDRRHQVRSAFSSVVTFLFDGYIALGGDVFLVLPNLLFQKLPPRRKVRDNKLSTLIVGLLHIYALKRGPAC